MVNKKGSIGSIWKICVKFKIGRRVVWRIIGCFKESMY